MPKLIKLTLFFSTILVLILGLIFLINYEKKQNKTDPKGNVIGIVIISRCSNCGKIKAKTIYTETNYER